MTLGSLTGQFPIALLESCDSVRLDEIDVEKDKNIYGIVVGFWSIFIPVSVPWLKS
jgi:hypothetical protein